MSISAAHQFFFPALWLSWAAYWWLASHGTKPDERREPLGSRLLHILPLLLVFGLLWAERVPVAFLNVRLFPWAPWEFWVAAFIAAAGLLFTVWARVHLAGNWSGIVTVKQNHELVTNGPYAIVRHPIYTGLLVAFIGSAIARGEWRGVLAVLIAWWALCRKLRMEERWMDERFGQQYEAFRRRVPALVPFWK